jgi:hypothetical protein
VTPLLSSPPAKNHSSRPRLALPCHYAPRSTLDARCSARPHPSRARAAFPSLFIFLPSTRRFHSFAASPHTAATLSHVRTHTHTITNTSPAFPFLPPFHTQHSEVHSFPSPVQHTYTHTNTHTHTHARTHTNTHAGGVCIASGARAGETCS